MKDILELIGTIIAAIVIFAVLSALPVMLLWNWLMPVIFGLTKITFLQSLGLTFLCGFLFRSSPSKNND